MFLTFLKNFLWRGDKKHGGASLKLTNVIALEEITDLDPLLLCRLLWLPVDEEEHQADDDQRLDQRGKEEDDPHVVAAALPFVLVQGLPCLRGKLGPGVAGAVHDCWRRNGSSRF